MTDQSRLREHPSNRFAPAEQQLNLDDEFEKLIRERHPGVQGHRQEAIYKHGPVTMVVFAFEPGGSIKEHVVPDGTVCIHVLDGELKIKTVQQEYCLRRNEVLLLAPGVAHDVVANGQSRMLLTVHLEGQVTDGR